MLDAPLIKSDIPCLPEEAAAIAAAPPVATAMPVATPAATELAISPLDREDEPDDSWDAITSDLKAMKAITT
jgi:hypothetical protein